LRRLIPIHLLKRLADIPMEDLTDSAASANDDALDEWVSQACGTALGLLVAFVAVGGLLYSGVCAGAKLLQQPSWPLAVALAVSALSSIFGVPAMAVWVTNRVSRLVRRLLAKEACPVAG
jgi:Na+-transporting methylmalonyl-CoA/oxaloacetate decarboxylase beta subunit